MLSRSPPPCDTCGNSTVWPVGTQDRSTRPSRTLCKLISPTLVAQPESVSQASVVAIKPGLSAMATDPARKQARYAHNNSTSCEYSMPRQH